MLALQKISITAMAVAMVVLQAACPAQAVSNDPTVAVQLQQTRSSLIVKERDLLRDYDDLNRQINDLMRRNDRSFNSRIDELSRKANDKFGDIRQVRLDLRDVETKLL